MVDRVGPEARGVLLEEFFVVGRRVFTRGYRGLPEGERGPQSAECACRGAEEEQARDDDGEQDGDEAKADSSAGVAKAQLV